MALVRMDKLLDKAEKEHYGIGAFNVGNMEMIIGTVKAAEEAKQPIIMQIAEVRLTHSPLDLIGPMMIHAARNASVDIAVHLDHGRSEKTIRQALELGFTSVMYDGSTFPYRTNVENTKRIVEMAKEYDACTEGELGIVGGSEGGGEGMKIRYTDPLDAKMFCQKTQVNALAVAIGNAHGNYKEAPNLRFDVLNQIREKTPVPLVLHGGSGISDNDFQEAIRYGIRKINIATASLNSLASSVRDCVLEKKKPSFFDLNEAMVEGTYRNVKHHIEVFSHV